MTTRSLKFGSLLVGVALLVLTPSLSFAYCLSPEFLPLLHQATFIEGCPDAEPVAGYAYAVATPSTNTGIITDFICEASFANGGITQQGSQCQAEAGVAGDGRITVSFDWSSATRGDAAGANCPISSATDPSGSGRNVLQIVANDGSSILVSVGYESVGQVFSVDAAHPLDPNTFESFPLRCSHDGGRPRVATVSGDTVCVNLMAPPIISDCDPESGGPAFGTCPDGIEPSSAPGRLYTRTGRCGTSPDTRLASGWALATTSPGPLGSQCLTVPAPTGECAFIGASGIIGTTETLAAVGAIQVAGPLAAADRAIEVRAAQAGGQVKVSFRTTTELLVTGFNVLTSSGRKVNTDLIPARGRNGAGATYEASIKRGEFRSEKALFVQSVLRDGRTINSDTTSF